MTPSEVVARSAVHNQRGFVRQLVSERDEKRRANRRRLWAAQRAQVAIARSLYGLQDPRAEGLKRYSLCRRYARGELVTVRERAGRCHFGDLVYCGSPWCIGCGAKIAEVRALEYAAAAARVIAAGGLVGFSTWTFSHGVEDSLTELLKLLGGAMTATDRNSKVGRAREGVRWHDVRRLDATHGPRAGFHAHRHVVTLYRPHTTPEQADELDRIEFAAYAGWLAKRGRTALYAQGHDFQIVEAQDAAAEVVRYLCKDALRELTYTATKWGRGENRSIAQVLADFHRDGLAGDRDVWVEYAIATKGKRAVRPSPGLRAELLADVAELTDEQVAELDDGLGLVVDELTRPEWASIWASQAGPAAVLDAAELQLLGGLNEPPRPQDQTGPSKPGPRAQR
jgi:hypothetical protein